jgi:hypothetical protein
MMGLTPHPEFAKKHAYDTFKHFPELRRTKEEIQNIHSEHTDQHNATQKHLRRKVLHTSTRKLGDLSKSSVHEVAGLFDFRKTLFENRKKTNKALELTKTDQNRPDKQLINQDPLTIANEKLSKTSLCYDPLSNNNDLRGFEGLVLNKKELQFLMRRCLNISLKPAEMDVLFITMDVDASGSIDGVEFVRYFIDMGNKARASRLRDKIDGIHKNLREIQEKKDQQEDVIKQYEKEQITEYTPEDLSSALKKLCKVALYWDPEADNSVATQYAFETYLTPYEFKRQTENCFLLKFTPSEMGALVAEYSTLELPACIDGYLFLKKFIALQTVSREENKIMQLANKKTLKLVHALLIEF